MCPSTYPTTPRGERGGSDGGSDAGVDGPSPMSGSLRMAANSRCAAAASGGGGGASEATAGARTSALSASSTLAQTPGAAFSSVRTWGGAARSKYGTPVAGTRTQYVQYAGPWGQAALRLRYVPNAGGWYA